MRSVPSQYLPARGPSPDALESTRCLAGSEGMEKMETTSSLLLYYCKVKGFKVLLSKNEGMEQMKILMLC